MGGKVVKQSEAQKTRNPLWSQKSIEIFFNTWTPELAYFLGYFAADGCMYHSRNGGYSTGGYYVEFTSIDRELVETIRLITGSKNKIELASRWRPMISRQRNRYKLRLVSKRAYEYLRQLGFTPNKTLTLNFPYVPNKLLGSFVRGYFDGDGHVYAGKYTAKSRRQSRQVLQVGFTSGSKPFLEEFHKRLKEIASIPGGSLVKRSNHHYVLQYSANSSRQLYSFMYPSTTVPCLNRKRIKFEEGIRLTERTRSSVG